MIDILEYLAKTRGIDTNKKPPIVFPKMKREHLAELFGEVGFKVGAEIGVAKGKFSLTLCKTNLKAKLYSIDPWKVHPEYKEGYTQEVLDACYEEAKKRLAPYNCEIIRDFSMNAVKRFKDGSLDFVYIDANHEFQAVTNDIAEWSKKVRVGGIVAGHDFTRYKRNPVCHVQDVVSAWAYSHKVKPWFIAKGNHGSTWFWVKR